MRLVALLQTTQYTDGRTLIRLVNHHDLEPALQGFVGLEVLLVLVERGGTYGAQVTTCQCRFQYVRGIHRAGGLTCTHERVYLINEQDDLAGSGGHFVDYAFQSLFELALVLCTRDECTHIEGVDFLALQVLRYVTTYNTVRQTLGDSGLTHTGFADEDRVVLCPAGEYL